MKKKVIRNLIVLLIGVLVLGGIYIAISSFKSNSQTSTTVSTSSENKSEELETKSKSDTQNDDSNSNNTKSDDKNANSNSNNDKSNNQNANSNSNNNTRAQKHFNYTMDSSKYNEFLTKLNIIEKNDAEGNEKAATTYDITMYANEFNKQYDTLLNDIYNYLKGVMPENEFKKLQNEEVKWINEKESAIKESHEKYKGGSINAYIGGLTSLGYTHNRIKELLEEVK
jgi:uncharacterized protein YecT (DUF1311 family)